MHRGYIHQHHRDACLFTMPHLHRESTARHANLDQNSHQGMQTSPHLLNSRGATQVLVPFTSSTVRGQWPSSGTRPQAGSQEPFPKARLKHNAHFICLFIYLLLTGKCNTKANYLIKAWGRVLMSQTSKQISKPLFCLQLQSGGHRVKAGWGGTGPLLPVAVVCPATAWGGRA